MITIERFFTEKEKDPFDDIKFEKRTALIADSDGKEIFRMDDVEVPVFWSQQATDILASKYLRKSGVPTEPGTETSVKQIIRRITKTIAEKGYKEGYFDIDEAHVFQEELDHILIQQKAAFNSPVWFNCGLYQRYKIKGNGVAHYYNPKSDNIIERTEEIYEHPSISACYIQSVEDSIEGMMDLARVEARIFKSGGGSGTNFSPIRGKSESLSGGGSSSGLMSFLKIFDVGAGAVKSGGTLRRSAKMTELDIDHPEIVDFIQWKAKEEDKAKALIQAGYEPGFEGEAYQTVSGQNSNNSVRITDEFMRSLEEGGNWSTITRKGLSLHKTYKASYLMDLICNSTHRCGDPGIQFDNNIEEWNTVKKSGKINGSNPCIRKGERILTNIGWMKIEDCANRENLFFFDGISYVPGKVWKTGRKKIIRIHSIKGRTIDVTEDQVFRTIFGEAKAKELKNINVPIIIPSSMASGENKIPKCITGGKKYYSHISDKLAQTLGFLQGDGSLNDSTKVVTIYYTPEKDKEFIKKIVVPILSDLSADKGKTYSPSKTKNKNSFEFCKMKLYDWLIEIGWNACSLPKRTLPNFLFTSSSGTQLSFLKGLFGANGNITINDKHKRYGIFLVSSCKKMLQEVQLILQGIGIKANVRRHDKEQKIKWKNGDYVSKESYHLEIVDHEGIYLFYKYINFPQKTQQNKLKTMLKRTTQNTSVSSSSITKLKQQKINKIEDLKIEDDVYDFRIETTSYGLINGFYVHNCAEVFFIDDIACNLASINLVKYYDDKAELFNYDEYFHTIKTLIIAQDILCEMASYPTAKIAENAYKFRPLGLGYTNLGALLMRMGFAYDSDEGRKMCSILTSLLTGHAYKTSSLLAEKLSPFEMFEHNKESMMGVMKKHYEYISDSGYPSIDEMIVCVWQDVLKYGKDYGFRNASTTCLAPTGTISLLMDCDTTGIEPDYALVKYKKLAGGGSMKIINKSVKYALKKSGKYNPIQIEAIENKILDTGTIEGIWPVEIEELLPIFDCAMKPENGNRFISPEAHLKMMEAAQPFLSMGISKTVNVPAEYTTEDIKEIYIKAWKIKLKAIAIYRDGSKSDQPLNVSSDEDDKIDLSLPDKINVRDLPGAHRKRLPQVRTGKTIEARVGGQKIYIRTGEYEDGTLGEIFVDMHKEGAAFRSILNCFAILVSLALQFGIPIEKLIDTFIFTRFEPNGITTHPNVRSCTSTVDFIFRILALYYTDRRDIIQVPEMEFEPKTSKKDFTVKIDKDGNETLYRYLPKTKATNDSPACRCGGMMTRTGTCYTCNNCGETSGCG